MNAHCTLEVLSTYVDGELSGPELVEVESHVETCDHCRKRLSRLQGVVGQLRRLEEVEAPPTLSWEVQRRVRLERDRSSLGHRVEERLGRLMRQPLLAPLFAVIIAFGAISYLLSLGVARHSAPGTRVVIGTREATVDTVDDAGGAATRSSADESVSAPTAASEQTGGEVGSVDIAGRNFRLVAGVWVESGLEGARAVRRIDLAAGDELPEALGWLREREGTWKVRLGDDVVEVSGGTTGAGG